MVYKMKPKNLMRLQEIRFFLMAVWTVYFTVSSNLICYLLSFGYIVECTGITL